MRPIQVLVVDDSVVVRRLVTNVLSEDPEIEVAGTAANGILALEKLQKLDVDIITLDIEMPEMNGIETLREVRKRYPRLPVIMFSTLTESGAAATLDCLASGANDFVTKPANVGSVTQAMQAVRVELIPKVKVLCGRNLVTGRSGGSASGSTTSDAVVAPAAPIRRPLGAPTTPMRRVLPPAPSAVGRVLPPSREHQSTSDGQRSTVPDQPIRARGAGRVHVVVIGVSTGGPNALAEIWPSLPRLSVPILIVQHMPPVFTTMLAKRLDAIGTVPVTEGEHGTEVMPGSAWLAPGDHHMVLDRSPMGAKIVINQDPHVNSCRPAVDPMFTAAADIYGPGVLAVVLTGMGSDGVAGVRAIRAAGGTVLAQDEASSVVWGMPGSVVNAGLADAVVPLHRMADEIVSRVGPVGARPTPTRRSTTESSANSPLKPAGVA